MSHTKGVFYNSKSSGGQCMVISEETGSTLAICYSQKNEGETLSNAKLFAAAPEMLKLLQRVQEEGISKELKMDIDYIICKAI